MTWHTVAGPRAAATVTQSSVTTESVGQPGTADGHSHGDGPAVTVAALAVRVCASGPGRRGSHSSYQRAAARLRAPGRAGPP